jgi:hypothetical protein
MGALRGGLMALLALAAALICWLPNTAAAESYDDFVESMRTTDAQGNDRSDAALMEMRAKQSAAQVAQAQKSSETASRFYGAAKKKIKSKFRKFADVAGEAYDVILALIRGDKTEALAEFAGGLVDLLVEYGIPWISRATCPLLVNPLAITACFGIAYVASKFDDEAEEWVKARVREGLDDDDEEVTRNRDSRYSGNIEIRARAGDINNSAVGASSSAVTDVGVARGGDVEIDVRVGDVTTSARSGSDVYTGIGVAEGDNVEIDALVGGDVATMGRGGGNATTHIGVSSGGDVGVSVREDVLTKSGSGSAETFIGTSTGSDIDVAVGGSVFTDGGRGSATTRIGTGKSAFIGGDVINRKGDLTIGGLCVAKRNGKCCIEVHRQLCVIQKVPPDSKGNCPPRFERYGWCYLYSDKAHRIRR